MDKSYLSRQIKLMTLNSYDLFTDEEFSTYERIIALKKTIALKTLNVKKKNEPFSDEEKDALMKEKTEAVKALERLIKSNSSTRSVRLKSILNTEKMQNAVSWNALKLSRQIAEFESEESRLLGVKTNEVTFDKIILKWKSIDVLEQIVKFGFDMPIFQPDGSIKTIHYIVVTASAGQLRTDKVQCLSEEAWNRIKQRLECGLSWETINEKGGINVNKWLAYMALASSATERTDIDIDRCIVVKDFEAPVTGLMDYIKPDYTIERGERTVIINHIDGCGMMLPSVSDRCFMARGPKQSWAR